MKVGRGIAVVHLVRNGNDPAALRGFVESYRQHPAGAPHELLVIYKGFPSESDARLQAGILEAIPHRVLHVDDSGFDIGSYRKAAEAAGSEWLVFLNSFSRVAKDGWLDAMARHVDAPGVAIVGATASWQSMSSDHRELQRLHFRRRRPLYRRALLAAYMEGRHLWRVAGRFPAFPNYHVRTNAFMIRREQYLEMCPRRFRTKWDAYRFESGAQSLTLKTLGLGMNVVVAGADGRAYRPEEWVESRTFWMGEQENLLVTDNQTRQYAEGDPWTRALLSHHAWRRFPDGREGSSFPEWRAR